MDDVKIGFDFVSGFLKVDRKQKEKDEKKKHALDGTEIPDAEKPKFIDNLFGKLDTEQVDQEIKDKEKSLENNLLKDKNIKTYNNALSYLSNVTQEKLQDNSKILDEILEKIKNKD